MGLDKIQKKNLQESEQKENTIIFITFLQIDSSTLLIRITNHSMYSENLGEENSSEAYFLKLNLTS